MTEENHTKFVYLNTASAGLRHSEVAVVMDEYVWLEQQLGSSAAELQGLSKLSAVKADLAHFVGATAAAEIALYDSASRAFNEIIRAVDWQPGDEVITTDQEYGSNWLSLLWLAKHYQVKIRVLTCHDGVLDLDEFKHLLNAKTKFISIVHLGSHGGYLQPVDEIGELVKHHDAIFCVDAAQSIGQVPLDIQAIQCDILIATGRKFLAGPRQTAFCFIAHNALEKLQPTYPNLYNVNSLSNEIDWVLDAQRLEQKEKNYGAVLGLHKAVNIINDNLPMLDTARQRIVRTLANSKLKPFQVFPTNGFIHCYQFSVPHQHIVEQLAACDPAILVQIWRSVSSPLLFADKSPRDFIRISPHYHTTEQQLAYFLTEIYKILRI